MLLSLRYANIIFLYDIQFTEANNIQKFVLILFFVLQGIEEGLTQMCKCSNDPRNLAVWNFPLDITFKSTNPHGCKSKLKLISLDALCNTHKCERHKKKYKSVKNRVLHFPNYK